MAEIKDTCEICGAVVKKEDTVAVIRKEGKKRKKHTFCSLRCQDDWARKELSEPLEEQVEKSHVNEDVMAAAEDSGKKEAISEIEYATKKAADEPAPQYKQMQKDEGKYETPGEGTSGRAEETMGYNEDKTPIKLPYWRCMLERIDPRRMLAKRDTERKDIYLSEYKEKSMGQELSAEQKVYEEKQKQSGAKKKKR